MKHNSTRALFDYWTRKRGSRRAPARSDIDPANIRGILADTFILTADFVNDIRIRLARTRICALFAREIKGEAFEDLWSEPSSEQMRGLLAAVIDENVGSVAGALGRTEQGAEIDLELLLLPLAFDDRTRVRALGALAPVAGALAPVAPPFWLGVRPVAELELGSFRHVGAYRAIAGDPHFGPVREAPRTRHGFRVYSGGLASPTGKRGG
jgi:hypothetical protein